MSRIQKIKFVLWLLSTVMAFAAIVISLISMSYKH